MDRDGDDKVACDQYLSEIYRITDPITRSRAVAARSRQLLRASSPDTFLGRRRFEPFPTENDGCGRPAMPERRVDEPAQRTSDGESQTGQQ